MTSSTHKYSSHKLFYTLFCINVRNYSRTLEPTTRHVEQIVGIPGKQTKVQRELKRRWRGRRSNSDENGVKHGRGRDKERRVVEKTRKLLTKIGDGG